MKPLAITFVIWFLAVLSWDLIKYRYETKTKSKMPELIDRWEAYWIYFKMKIGVIEKEIKEGRQDVAVVHCDIEEALPTRTKEEGQPRVTAWEVSTVYQLGERSTTTKQIENE